MYITNTNYPVCTAHISVNKNRVKTYGSEKSVFLKDGQNFEIELYNPKQDSVLAKISINGRDISTSGFVLKPGQRVFVERFIDEAKKFAFSTYEVSDTSQNRIAIQNNGLIEIGFYDEHIPFSKINWYTNYSPNYHIHTNGTQFLPLNLNLTGTTTSASYSTNNASVAGSFSNNSIETGRIEAGSSSNQTFETVYGNFNSWASSTEIIKILPASQKPVENIEVRNYCTNCGSRAKKMTWKFCPSCGNKF